MDKTTQNHIQEFQKELSKLLFKYHLIGDGDGDCDVEVKTVNNSIPHYKINFSFSFSPKLEE